MTMTFGIHIGHMGGPLDEMRRLWKFADEMGFDWFSVADHFQESPPQGGDMDCFEGIASLAAAAVETKRVRLASMVHCVLYRNPGLLAKSLTTIDPLTILRTVNLGFYLGADAKGAARGEQVYQRHFGGRSDGREQRTGYLRGTPKDVMDMIGRFRDFGCRRLNIAFREGPYDWEAL